MARSTNLKNRCCEPSQPAFIEKPLALQPGAFSLFTPRSPRSASPDIVSRNSLGERNRRFAHRQALGVRRAFQAEIRAKVVDKKSYCLTGVKVDPDLLV